MYMQLLKCKTGSQQEQCPAQSSQLTSRQAVYERNQTASREKRSWSGIQSGRRGPGLFVSKMLN